MSNRDDDEDQLSSGAESTCQWGSVLVFRGFSRAALQRLMGSVRKIVSSYSESCLVSLCSFFDGSRFQFAMSRDVNGSLTGSL